MTLRMCLQVTKQDSSALRTDAWDRTLSDWLRRADEANHEVAVEAKRNHTHHVHSVLGGKSILTDTEITMPEDDLASQVWPLISAACIACRRGFLLWCRLTLFPCNVPLVCWRTH